MMSTGRMHVDEVETDASLVRRLLAAQFPRWADLPIAPVLSSGTDNAIYRLGDDMAVRMPRIHWAVDQVEKEQRWLPTLAPLLPVAIPVPLGKGEPADGYPWHWSVYGWLSGENPAADRVRDPGSLATALARFVAALHRIDPTDGPPPGEHNSGRGVPLRERDAPTREAIDALQGVVDIAGVTAAWEAALRAPDWQGPPIWIHGDLAAGNLLVEQDRLNAVIDFGCLGVGDPACDLSVAWNLLPVGARSVFRNAVPVDDATWERGRGWALSTALIALPYYSVTNPVLADSARHTIAAVLADARLDRDVRD